MADRWEYRNERGYGDRPERPVSDRAGDEVRSWFGDDDAARRRHMDEMRDRDDRERHWSDRTARAGERAWDRTRESFRDLTDRDRDGRTGFAEFADNDRYSRPYSAGYRDDYWTRERSFGDTSRYATADRYAYPMARTQYSTRDRWDRWDGPSYAGRGPRGYQRTDQRIHEEVCDRLTDDPRIDASDIEVHIKGGELTLEGSVRSREERRFAEECVERITGVRDVNNHLKVRPPNEVLGTARSGSSVLGLSDNPPAPSREHH